MEPAAAWEIVVSIILLSGVIYSIVGIIRRLIGLPRPIPEKTVWRGSSGRFVSPKKAIWAWVSFMGAFFVFWMSSLGTPQIVVNYAELLLAYVTQNFDVSAALSIISHFVGWIVNPS